MFPTKIEALLQCQRYDLVVNSINQLRRLNVPLDYVGLIANYLKDRYSLSKDKKYIPVRKWLEKSPTEQSEEIIGLLLALNKK